MENPARSYTIAAAAVTAVLAAVVAYWVLKTSKAAPTEVDGDSDDAAAALVRKTLESADDDQVTMMKERCIVVDSADRPVRPASKAECHQWSRIKGRGGLIHRAFSVFLFDTKGRLVLQKRSEAKITFPNYWANTCCSHPLWNAEEMEREGDAGVKRAAQRKLEQELGIDPATLPLTNFHWVGRVHYRAPCEDGLWGEHEIDHVLLAMPDVDVVLSPNPNEVQDTLSLGQEELRSWLAAAPAAGTKVSAWFNVIQSEMLPGWWEAVTKVRTAQARGEAIDVAAAFAPLRWSAILRAGDHVANAAATPSFAAPKAAAGREAASVEAAAGASVVAGSADRKLAGGAPAALLPVDAEADFKH